MTSLIHAEIVEMALGSLNSTMSANFDTRFKKMNRWPQVDLFRMQVRSLEHFLSSKETVELIKTLGLFEFSTYVLGEKTFTSMK